MKKALLILTVGIGLFVSCKKEDSNSSSTGTQLTTAQKIQNKWNLVSVLDINYIGASTTIDYIDTLVIGTPSDYLEFKPNKKVYIWLEGELDSSTYDILSDTKIVFDGEILDIAKLTSTEFVMSYSERMDTPYFDNVITLKR